VTLVIGHRGNSSVAPQNTLAAFEAAARAGADLVELDLQLTADGQIVVIHDDTVDATTSGSGPVSDYTFDDLRALDAGSWFAPSFAGQRVPLFAEVLTLLHHHPQVGLLAEFKDVWTPEDAAQATAAIIGTGLAERTIVQSFYPQTVAALRDVAPSLRRGLLIVEPHDGLLDACADLASSRATRLSR
jgi:glycerophosphoryl diester phosphodiesterase